MKKVFVFTIVLIASYVNLTAQKKDGNTRFSIGPEIGFATGTFSLGWSLGIGASVQVEHYFKEKISGTALLGFNSFFGKSVSNSTKNKAQVIIPLRVGARYYITEGLHAGLQLGVGFLSGTGSSSASFAYSPQLGYNFRTNKGKAIDATLKYDAYAAAFPVGTIGAIGVRVAYIF